MCWTRLLENGHFFHHPVEPEVFLATAGGCLLMMGYRPPTKISSRKKNIDVCLRNVDKRQKQLFRLRISQDARKHKLNDAWLMPFKETPWNHGMIVFQHGNPSTNPISKLYNWSEEKCSRTEACQRAVSCWGQLKCVTTSAFESDWILHSFGSPASPVFQTCGKT